MTAEGDRIAAFGRLEDGLKQASPWYTWGPYVSERQWGTVREDYSEDGDAWNYLPHDHARSRAYRWGEDGLAGFCDVEQRLCLGLALWNGRDPCLKERLFGLTGPEGNSKAEDAVVVVRGGEAVVVEHPFLGTLELLADDGPDGLAPSVLFCENESNTERLFGCAPATPYPKDGINDHVVSGKASVNPDQAGTKCSFWYRLTVEPGGTTEIRLRLRPKGTTDATPAFGANFDRTVADRKAEADEFYEDLTPSAASQDEGMVMRQAFAGMLWCKQFYDYDVARWLDGDPAQPPPPPDRGLNRNARWRTFNAFDIMSMPDKWEYPWFAAWDLAFQCVALAHVDPGFAKYQLVLLCREWFQHPNGALPAYEWDFSDVNPPVQAWAALEVFALDGGRDLDFLSRIFDKLLVNFTWWVNREDIWGNNLFEGGFLGLDNIGPIDRSHLPPGTVLEQSDATGWMAFYALSMAMIASVLCRSGRRQGADLVLKFLEHYAAIAGALESQGMWDDADGMFYDHLCLASGAVIPVKARSMVGMIPLLAMAIVDEAMMRNAMKFGKQFADFLDRQGLADAAKLREQGLLRDDDGGAERLLLSVVGSDRLVVLFRSLFDESRFLSAYGLRSLSAVHRDQPYVLHLEGTTATIDYEPAESTTAMFGGNSNWRGPIWFPLNYLVISSLLRYHKFFGDDLTVEYPTGSGQHRTLEEIAQDLRDRLISIFTRGADGRRPCFGWVDRLQHDPRWRDNVCFNEYFHGDNAAGLGASHQTGWTGLIADVIRRRHGAVPETVNLVSDLLYPRQ